MKKKIKRNLGLDFISLAYQYISPNTIYTIYTNILQFMLKRSISSKKFVEFKKYKNLPKPMKF